jgi:hypothetical protein
LPSYELAPKGQMRHARDQVASKVFHGLIPWAAWAAMTAVFGPLPLLLPRWAWLVALMVLVPGLLLACFVAHLHASRVSLVGKAIGPATLVAGSSVTAAWLLAGLSVPMALAWTLGGWAVCIGWDAWLHTAGSHELALGFGRASETAWGAAGRLTVDKPQRERRPRRGGRPDDGAPPPAERPDPRRRGVRPTVRGRVQLPPEVGADEAAAAMRRVEQGLQFPPGSATMRQAPDNSAFGNFTATDPRRLEVPEDWPGPSAPGADMSAPFRMGTFQDGAPVLVPQLDVFHTQAMGKSGTAKTMGWTYNQLAEGVTREGYAALVIDISKGSQFYGAWGSALHAFQTQEEPALRLMRGLHRARLARSEKLAKDHYTEWVPGCGLSFLDIFMAEAPDIIALLETAKTREANSLMSLREWQSDVKNGRSAGERWNLDNQLSLASQIPSVAQGQLSHLCFGVDTPEQAKYGLSARQRAAGCAPELWGSRFPGMAYWDAPTLDDEHAVMALRFYYWRGKARQAFEYAGLYPSIDRPLDDVTAEALAWTPPVQPSLELPGPGGTLSGIVPPPRPAKVTSIFAKGPRKPDLHDEAAEAEAALWKAIVAMMARRKPVDGVRDNSFVLYDLRQAGFDDRVGRSRSWLYDALSSFEQQGRLELVAEKPRKRWRMLAMPAQEREAE